MLSVIDAIDDDGVTEGVAKFLLLRFVLVATAPAGQYVRTGMLPAGVIIYVKGVVVIIKVNELEDARRGVNYFVGKQIVDHEILKYVKQKTLVGYFGSLKALWTAIVELNWEPKQAKSSDDSGRGDFQSFDSLDEALEIFKRNPRSVRSFTEDNLTLTAEEAIGKDVTFDVSGDYLDIGKFMEGAPECFGVAHNGNPSNLTVNLVMNMSAAAYVDSKAIIAKQARLLRLVDWLENQNVRCRITAFESTHTAHMEVVLKDYDEMVDLNDIAVVGHSDFLRRVCFLMSEQSDTWTSGYGHPADFTQAMKRNFTADPADGLTIFIGHQNTSDISGIDVEFDKLRDKLVDVIHNSSAADFSTVYLLELD